MDLDRVERLIRNPSSASVSTELLLELVAHARELEARLASPAVVVAPISLPPEPVTPVVVIDDRPTPPASPAAKRKAK